MQIYICQMPGGKQVVGLRTDNGTSITMTKEEGSDYWSTGSYVIPEREECLSREAIDVADALRARIEVRDLQKRLDQAEGYNTLGAAKLMPAIDEQPPVKKMFGENLESITVNYQRVQK